MTPARGSIGRFWRTVRPLTAEQWAWRAARQGERIAARAMPAALHAATAAAADRLPLPDPSSPALRAAAAPVAVLQQAVHGAHCEGVAKGRFVLLNRDYDFGGIERVAWRGDFHEGANPLRRMTLAYMGWAVPLLATGKAEDFATVARLLAGFEEAGRWTTPGVLGDVWHPYTTSHRLINLLCGLALHRAAGGRPGAAETQGFGEHVRFAAAHVRARLERGLKYNHLMKNLVALSVYAAALPKPPPALAFLAEAVPRAIGESVLEDGGHAERSPMYHALALLDLTVLRETGLFKAQWQPALDDALDRMRDALAVMTHPDGDIALFNDAWLGEAPPARELTSTTPADIERLPAAGYTRMGRGGEAIILDCGACGPDDNPGHAHGDFLSIEMSLGGHRLIVDPGVPTYTAGALRDHARSAASHNGPQIAGIEPLEFWRSFRVGRRGRAAPLLDSALGGIAPLWCAGYQTGYDHAGMRVKRWVGLWPGAAAMICDLWQGPFGRPEASRFLIDGAWRLDDESPGVAFVQGTTRVAIHAHIGKLQRVRPGRWWPRFGAEAPAHRLAIVPEDMGEFRCAMLWLRWAEASPPGTLTITGLFDRLADC